jgi:hypothetical protein
MTFSENESNFFYGKVNVEYPLRQDLLERALKDYFTPQKAPPFMAGMKKKNVHSLIEGGVQSPALSNGVYALLIAQISKSD